MPRFMPHSQVHPWEQRNEKESVSVEGKMAHSNGEDIPEGGHYWRIKIAPIRQGGISPRALSGKPRTEEWWGRARWEGRRIEDEKYRCSLCKGPRGGEFGASSSGRLPGLQKQESGRALHTPPLQGPPTAPTWTSLLPEMSYICSIIVLIQTGHVLYF